MCAYMHTYESSNIFDTYTNKVRNEISSRMAKSRKRASIATATRRSLERMTIINLIVKQSSRSFYPGISDIPLDSSRRSHENDCEFIHEKRPSSPGKAATGVPAFASV